MIAKAEKLDNIHYMYKWIYFKNFIIKSFNNQLSVLYRYLYPENMKIVIFLFIYMGILNFTCKYNTINN